jgi:hypothetical protein
VDGTTEQIVALTIVGNAFLKNISVGGFWPDSPVFQFCRSVRFIASAAEPHAGIGKVVAADPVEWFCQLRDTTRGLRLRALTRNDPSRDRIFAGLVGGGPRWIIDAVRNDGMVQCWEGQWQVIESEPHDDRIWTVAYWKLSEQDVSARPDRSMADVSADLSEALAQIAEFATRCGSHFSKYFTAALDVLNGQDDEVSVRRLDPAHLLGTTAQRLLSACQTAWVFGAMGSWNDGAYGGEFGPEGDRLSDHLFGLLQEAVAVSANSTFPCRA